MLARRRRRALGSSDGIHEAAAVRSANYAEDMAKNAAALIDRGDCRGAFRALLSARGSSAAAVAHRASTTRSFVDVGTGVVTVERAENYFADRCVSRRKKRR
jgi:hypothetical protein